MSAISPAVSFPAMPRKEKSPQQTDQINFRLKLATIERMEAYKDRHPLHPTLTQIVEAAVGDWLDRHEPELPPKSKRG